MASDHQKAPVIIPSYLRLICVLTAFFAIQLFLWALWQKWAILPYGALSAVVDAVVIKGILWAVPFLLVLQRFAGLVEGRRLFAEPFPWLPCVVILCLSAAFLFTVRLLNGLVNTYPIFDPLSLLFSLSAGVIEEFCFRGGYFNIVEPKLGFWPAAVLNGAAFTLYHYPGLFFGESWVQLLSLRALLIFVMGVLFCWMFRKWRNLALNMTVHAIWDILSYLFCLTG